MLIRLRHALTVTKPDATGNRMASTVHLRRKILQNGPLMKYAG